MHLIQAYSLETNSKISNPDIYESFFPIPADSYVTFQAQSKYPAKDYSFFQDFINIIFPFLQKENIQILQLGMPNEALYQRVIDLRGRTSYNQMAYIIKRAKCHIGPDSIGIHLASAFNVPIVGLYSVSSTEISGPYFGDKNKQILFKGYERVKNGRPSFQAQEDTKSINTIKPEEIANATLKLLDIDFKIPFETIYTGIKYGQGIFRELIPDGQFQIPQPEIPVEIRYDLSSNEQFLGFHLSYLQKGIIITNKPIDIQFLKNFKPHIAAIVYKVTENDEPKFIKEAATLGVPLILTSELEKSKIDAKKIDYYEIGKINIIAPPAQETIDKLRPDIDKLYYRSNKYLISEGKMYNSHSSLANKIEFKNDFEYQKVVDSPEFWKDLEFFTIIKKN